MANNYSKIRELASKNSMGLSSSIKRDYGIPLDYSSIQETYEDALAYAKTSTLAYIGQPISVGDMLYIVTDEVGGYLKPVGTIPAGDELSITITDDGKIALKGFEAAANATLPRKKADGTIEWVPIDAIVAGDGNTKTILEVAEGSALSITSLEDAYDAETDTYTYTLDVTLPSIPEYSLAKEIGTDKITYKLTKDGIATGEFIDVPNAYDDSVLTKRVSDVEATITEHSGRIDNVEEKVDTFFAAVENPDEVIDTLAEIQKYITDDKSGAAVMAANIKSNTDAIEVLNGTEEGSVQSKISSAIATKSAEDAGKYATQEALAAVSAKADAAAVKTEVETALATKADKTTLLNNYYTKSDIYDKDEVDALLRGITVDTGETASQVAAQLAQHKSENDTKFEELDSKNTDQDSAIQKNTDDIVAINNETTGIYARAIEKAAVDAQAKVNALADGAVATNTSNISAISNNIENINGTIATLLDKVTVFEQKDTTLEDDLAEEVLARETLAETVVAQATDISELEKKDAELAALISSNTAKFANYLTAEDVRKEIDNKIVAIDYSKISKDISDAVSVETSRAQTKEGELAGLISTNTTEIAKNTSEISRIDELLKSVLENNGEGIDSLKELAIWIENHETDVLPAIQANTNAIATLTGTGEGSIKKTVDDAIAAIPIATALDAGTVKASEEVTVSADGTMGIGLISVDKLVQGSNTLILQGGNATVIQ